jgi:hypothetical protein
MEEASPVIVELVRQAPLQSLTCVIQTLLRVTEPVQELPRKRTRASIDLPLKIDNIGHNQFTGCAGSRRPQVRHEIADGKIDFMADRRDYWYRGIKYRSRHDFFVELP